MRQRSNRLTCPSRATTLRASLVQAQAGPDPGRGGRLAPGGQRLRRRTRSAAAATQGRHRTHDRGRHDPRDDHDGGVNDHQSTDDSRADHHASGAGGIAADDQAPPAGDHESAARLYPSYPDVCLDPEATDYDCAGGSGNGPEYVRGPIRVLPPDPFDLDREGDGVGCES